MRGEGKVRQRGMGVGAKRGVSLANTGGMFGRNARPLSSWCKDTTSSIDGVRQRAIMALNGGIKEDFSDYANIAENQF